MGAFFKKNYVHFVAIGIFLIAAAAFFSPAIGGKYVPKMHDITTHRSSSKELADLKNLHGEESYWTSRTFSGMPAYQIYTSYPKGVPKFFKDVLTLWLPYPINMLFLLFVSLYILLQCLKVDPWLSIIGALAFGFCSHFIIILGAGHTSKTHAMAYIPAILGAFIGTLRSHKKYWLYGIAFALFFSLQLYANHYQITYYTAIMLLLTGVFLYPVAIVNGVKRYRANNKQGRSPVFEIVMKPVVLIMAGLIAFGISSPGIMMTNDFAKHTIRGKSELTVDKNGNPINKNDFNETDGLRRDYITEYSYDKGELLSTIIPNSIENPDYIEFLRDLSPAEYEALHTAYNANANQLSRNRHVFGAAYPAQYLNYIETVPNYFGDQTMARARYIGALIFFLAIVGLIYSRGWVRWGLLASSLLAILLALGQNLGGSEENMWLTNFFIDNIPLYNKFRAVKMIMVIVEVVIPVLAMLGLHQILKDRERAAKMKKPFLIISGAFLIFMVANIANPELIASFYSSNEMAVIDNYGGELFSTNPPAASVFESATEKVKEYRISGYRSDALRALMFVIGGIGILLLYFFKVISRVVVIPVLGLLLLIDMVGVGNRFVNREKDGKDYVAWQLTSDMNKRPVTPGMADLEILRAESANIPDFEMRAKKDQKVLKAQGLIENSMDKQIARYTTLNFNSNFRVLRLSDPFNDGQTPFLHKATGGYNAAKLQKFQEIIEFRLYDEMQSLQDPTAIKALNMLNTKYFIKPDDNNTPQEDSQMYLNPFAFGNAWFAKGFHKVEDANEAILAIDEVDVSELAIVQAKYFDRINESIQEDPEAKIVQRTLDYRPQHLTYDFDSKTDQFVVFSEVYYEDGWNAYIDNQPVEHVPVNYILRGLSVPAGQHIIEFKFEPKKVGTLNTVATASSIILVLLILGSGFMLFKEMRNPAPVNGKS